MRITNGLLQRAALQGIQSNLGKLADTQRQISTGLKVERASDDPIAATGILATSSQLRAIEQYQRNLGTARSRLDIEDSTLEQLGNALSRARQLGISHAGVADPSTYSVTKAEVDQLIEAIKQLGNTKFSGSYLFGGDYALDRPFPDSGPDPLRPPAGTVQVEAGSGQLLETNHSGAEIFIDSGVLDALESLSVGLDNKSSDEIADAVNDIDTAFDKVQDLVGELGARMNLVDNAMGNLDALDINLRTFRSDLRDVELEEAVTDLISQQVAYQAALAANSSILQLTLTNYL